MATLKDHQKAMVDLLANGSAIPASAARLAHALHDVLGLLLELNSEPHSSSINDVRLAADLAAVPERGSALIANLRAELARVTDERDMLEVACESLRAEIAGRCDTYEEVKKENDELKTKLEDKEEQLGY